MNRQFRGAGAAALLVSATVYPAQIARLRAGSPGWTLLRMVDGDSVTIPLQLFMISDIAITCVAGEVFTEVGQHVLNDSLFDRTMMVTVVANKAGYSPTDKAVGNPIKAGCVEPAMANEFQSMMRSYLPVRKAAK